MKKKTKEEYTKDFNENMEKYHPNIEILDEYINSTTKLNCRCKIDGYKWMSSPNNLISKDRKRGCPKCAGNVLKTHDEFEQELKKRQPYLIMLNKYINNKIKVKLLCLECNRETEILPRNLLHSNNQNCAFCNRYNKLTVSEYKQKLKEVNPNIILLGDYKDLHIKITHYCLIHLKTFEIDPEHALRGQGCSDCKLMKIGNARRKDVSEYIKQLKSVNPNVVLNGEYVNGNNNTPHKCLRCGYEWDTRPLNLLHGCDCPICSSSKGEKQVRSSLEKYKINFIEQYRFDDCRYKKPLPFDFYLPDYNICIEYQGEQHYRPVCFGGIDMIVAIENFKIVKIRDLIKKNYCNKSSIKLIEISYLDFKEIDNILSKIN